MINDIDIAKTLNNVDKKLIINRISIALFSFGLNEFYTAFKYLKSVIVYCFNKNDISKNSVKEAMMVVAKYYKVTQKTIINSLTKLYQHLPVDFFLLSPLFLKIKMNCYHKTQFIAEMVFLDLQKY